MGIVIRSELLTADAFLQMDQRRADLQRVEGVREVVELYQDRIAARIYRPDADASWSVEAIVRPTPFWRSRASA